MFYKLNVLSWLLSIILIIGCDVTKKRNKEVAATGNTWYQKDYVYSDGNANRYVFSKNGFEYFPVSPAESSSGNNSGGTYIKKLPELSLFYAVVNNIKMAFETKADHTDTRQMGSGLIEIREKGNQSKFMIKMGSRSQLLIEEGLKKIKDAR
ncbi:MAG: hypothetical protein SGI83_17220 [Bacteroidota bacterium]|nr:hypothetical protein [Bacteroidota bacterium]